VTVATEQRGQRTGESVHLRPTVLDMFTLTPKAFRAVCGVALASLCVIVFTGALVRLTGSGLGCADWPRCSSEKFIDVSAGHTLIEQANRLFTGVVSVSVIAAVLFAYRRQNRQTRIIWYAWGLVVGVIAQVVVGGIVVLTGLNPFANMAHFLISMALVANAFILYRSSADDHVSPVFRHSPSVHHRLFPVLGLLSIIALVTGTVVTASGPHAGDENAVRFGFALSSVARIHSATIICTVALVCFIAFKLRTSKDASSIDAMSALLVVSLMQGAVGYTQYFTGVPVFLVSAHILGAIAFWLSVCNVMFAPR